MDFLDPKKQRAHIIRLYVGYVLIGLAILIATTILVHWASGLGIDKDGKVVQNGFVFVSSQPDGAKIYLNDTKHRDNTNTRIQLTEGAYKLEVRKDGYKPWLRQIEVGGSTVSRYDYPLLIPNELTPTPVRNYASVPAFATQSPDRKWVIIQKPGSLTNFDLYDLGDPRQAGNTVTEIAVPAAALSSAGSGDHSWKLAEWSNNNRHAVLERTFAGGMEYILLDREEPERTVNLTRTLSLGPGQVLSLRDKKYDKYYVFDPAAKTVNSVNLSAPAEQLPVLASALAFKSYGEDMLLYATETDAPAGRILTVLRDGDVTYNIRELAIGAPYLLDVAKFDGDWFVAVGASAENKAYVFKNPQAARKSGRVSVLVPVHILRVNAPNYISFSSNTRFIMVENAGSISVYDVDLDKGYIYSVTQPIDAPQQRASWMDGHRLVYISGGRLLIVDYDNINAQPLVAATPTLPPFFDRDYEYLFTLTPPTHATGQSLLTSTSLRTAADR